MYGVFLPLFNWLPSRSLFFHQFGLSGEFKKALSIDWLTGTDRLRLRKCARWLVICGNSIRTELIADEAVSHTPSINTVGCEWKRLAAIRARIRRKHALGHHSPQQTDFLVGYNITFQA